MSGAVFWLAALCASVLMVAAMSVPISALVWWAGWRRRPPTAALGSPPAVPPADGPFVVYLSGIGDISGEYSTHYEDRFLTALAAGLPGLVLISDVFPYSIQNLSMTSQRHLGRFWGWVNTERLGKGPLKRVGLLIDLRNILHTAFAADSRYGPIYGYDSAEMIIQGLLRQGYRLGSGAPVSLLGYSGGAQIALVSAGYLQATLRAPVQVISLGGLMNPSPALDQIAALTHFYGRRDTMQRLSAVFFPGRWPRRTKTRWARGVASGTIRMICLGPMDHAAVGSYFDDGTYMPDGRSFMQISVNAVANQIRWLSGTNSLDERSLYRRGLGPLDISVLNAPMGHMNKQGDNMDGYVHDIADIATANEDFRRVLYTAAHCQLVVMALKPQEDIGAEVHTLDQCLYVAEGTGEAVLDGVRTAIHAGSVIVVPAGVHHNIINTGSVPLRLSTLYAPPNHRDGVIHHTRAEADADSEHFDGKTTEDAAREHVIHA